MARIRSIKPDFFTNEGMSTISEAAQLLAGGLLCYADDEGYFNANPGLVKAAVFPLREPSSPVPDCLAALASIGYARFGTGKDGKRYGHIVKFADHQKVSHAIPSKIKKMEIVWEDSGEIPEGSVRTPAILRPELNRIELNRKEPRSSKTDERYTVFVEAISKYWAHKNPDLKFNLSSADGKQLKNFLAAHPNVTIEQFKTCLNHRGKSEVVHSQAINRWISRTLEFFEGPLDQYWKPKSGPTAVSPPRAPVSNAAADAELERQGIKVVK